MNTILEIENVSHSRNGMPVLNNINLKIAQGETVAIVGPSGSGKSTLLDIIMGQIQPDFGAIYVDNTKVVEPSRDRGIVYQKYTLFSFATIEQNVALGPMIEATSLPYRFLCSFRDKPINWLRKIGLCRRHRTVEDPYIEDAHRWLERFGLMNSAKRYPKQLSGGMQQRCAIAQALIMHPKVLLMDEPFGALDPQIRSGCQRIMLDLQVENLDRVRERREPKHTIVFVTHDRSEAIKIADRVIAISQYHPDGANGATIVFDQATPNFDPVNPVAFDFPKAVQMEADILSAAMDPQNLGEKEQFITFWHEVEMGLVQGIFEGRRVKV
jgi:NitT/TauT family transport system ATP-binding protein